MIPVEVGATSHVPGALTFIDELTERPRTVMVYELQGVDLWFDNGMATAMIIKYGADADRPDSFICDGFPPVLEMVDAAWAELELGAVE